MKQAEREMPDTRSGQAIGGSGKALLPMLDNLRLRCGRFIQLKFVRDAFSLSAGRAINVLIGMCSTLIYGLVFATSQIAVVSLFQMVVDLVIAFGVSWSDVGITRFGKGELRKNGSLCYTSSTRLYVMLPILFAAVLVIVLFRTSILEYLGTDQTSLVWYLIASLLLIGAHAHLRSMFTARESHFSNALFNVVRGLGNLLILFVFLSGLVEPTVVRYVAATVWLDMLWLIIRVPMCGRSFLYPVCRVRGEDISTYFRYVAPQLYGFAGIYVINWIDVYFIRKYGTMEALGAYQFLYMIFVKIASFAMLANALLFPRIMDWKQNNVSAVSRFTRRAPQAVFLATMVACGTLLLVYRPVFSLFFGDKYVVAYPSFSLLICAVPFYYLTFLLVPVLNSFDRVHYIQTVNIIAAVSNFLLDFALVPRYGIMGAALATFVAYSATAVLLMVAVHRLFGVQFLLLSALSLIVVTCAAVQFVAAARV